MSETNKRVVKAFFEHMSAGEVDSAIDCFADDVTWETVMHTRPGLQSKEDKRTSFGGILARYPGGDFKIWPIAIVAEGDRVCVEAESRGVVSADKIYNNRYHFAFVMKDGKIREAREYCDTDYVTAFTKSIA